MSNLAVCPGDTIPLSTQLWDRDAGKYVRARLYDTTDTEIVGSPVSLTHTTGGLYTASGPAMPSDFLSVVINVYDDALFTTLSVCHLPGALCVEPTKECTILDRINEIIARIDGVLGSVNPITVEIAREEIDCIVEDLHSIIEIVESEPIVDIDANAVDVESEDNETTVTTEKCDQ